MKPLIVFLILLTILSACYASREIEVVAEIVTITTTSVDGLLEVTFNVLERTDTIDPNTRLTISRDWISTTFAMDELEDLRVGDEVTMRCRTTWLYEVLNNSCFLK
jgi:hypothetical protein